MNLIQTWSSLAMLLWRNQVWKMSLCSLPDRFRPIWCLNQLNSGLKRGNFIIFPDHQLKGSLNFDFNLFLYLEFSYFPKVYWVISLVISAKFIVRSLTEKSCLICWQNGTSSMAKCLSFSFTIRYVWLHRTRIWSK